VITANFKIQTIFFFLISFALQFNAQTFDQRMKEIDRITSDSAAYGELDQFAKNKSLTVKELLYVRQRQIIRGLRIQKYTASILLAFEACEIAEKNKCDSLASAFYKYIGNANFYMDRKRNSISYYEKAIEIAHKNNYWELEASCYNNIGGALTDLKQPTYAEPYLLKSIELLEKNGKGNADAAIRSYRVLARSYDALNKAEKAEPIYVSLIDKCKAIHDTDMYYDNLAYYSAHLAKKGKFDKAIEMSREALRYRRTKKNMDNLRTAIGIHSSNLYKAKHYEEAHILLVELQMIFRKEFASHLKKEISAAEVRFKTMQIKQEKELAELNAKKQKQIYLISIISILVVGLFGIFIWNQKRKARHFSELAEADKLRFKDVIDAEEKERSRIAQELHDGLGQLLSVARLNVAGLEDAVSDEDKDHLNRSLKIIDDACTEVRNISHNMMPSALIRLGLIPAINEVVNNVNSANGVKIDFKSNLDVSLGQSLDITVYRVVQEILNNMIKHAKADHINMSIERVGGELRISMQDNGIGFNTEEIKNSKGIGWKNIFSRVSMLDGDIRLESEPEKGTLIFINLKLKNG
jgi:signal transduction histidine kinase